VIGVPAAYALSRWTSAAAAGRSRCGSWPAAWRPPIAFTIPYFLVYRHLELLDTLTGLVIIYLTFNLSLVIWMMRAVLATSCRARSRRRHGSTAPTMWQGFYRIILPLSGPGLGGDGDPVLSVRLERLLLRPDPDPHRGQTAPVAVVNFMNYEGWEWGRIAAGGTMIMLPVLVFSFVVRRYLVHGLTGGAIKG